MEASLSFTEPHKKNDNQNKNLKVNKPTVEWTFKQWASVIHRLPGCGLTGYPLGFHRLVTMNQTPPARAINLTRVLDLTTCFVYESKVIFL